MIYSLVFYAFENLSQLKCFISGFNSLFDGSLTRIFRLISYYATSSTDSAAYIIGGYAINMAGDAWFTSSVVAEFSQSPIESVGSWKHRGDTLRARQGARAIQINDQTVLIGGHREKYR